MRTNATIERPRALLQAVVPEGCWVSNRRETFHCSDELAVTAEIVVAREDGIRLVVLDGEADPMIVSVWLGYQLTSEVWCVDGQQRRIEQFSIGEARALGPGEVVRSVALPGLELPVSAVFGEN
jgi:hypothetical protein